MTEQTEYIPEKHHEVPGRHHEENTQSLLQHNRIEFIQTRLNEVDNKDKAHVPNRALLVYNTTVKIL